MEKIKILIVDDHEIVRTGFSSLINSKKDLEVVGYASNGLLALAQIELKKPNLVLLDLIMPKMDGIECCTNIRALYPEIKIIGLSMVDDLKLIQEMIEKGASGFLLKNCTEDELMTAIHRVCRGEQYYDPAIAKLLTQLSKRNEEKRTSILPKLSLRELDILKLILEEYTTKEIAEELDIKFGTVESHRRNMMTKLGVRNLAGLVKIAIKNNLV